ncbi:MAG: TetR/AcrR family transcriptional regulator [Spirochaetales bacterium]|nr:TetR/AcrR family transcriptional regulator [Spirochaetales bacterium]
MQRKACILKEDIIKAAVEIVRENGYENLNARTLASRLGCSTQPIFSNFKNMQDLFESVLEATLGIYNSFVADSIKNGVSEPVYKAHGRAYIKFAMEEKNLFMLLFMRNRSEEKNPVEESTFYDVLPLIMKATGMNEKQAALFHFEIWSAVHGIAVMAATSYNQLSMELISETLTDIYQGLSYRFKNKEGSDEERN